MSTTKTRRCDTHAEKPKHYLKTAEVKFATMKSPACVWGNMSRLVDLRELEVALKPLKLWIIKGFANYYR